MTYWMQRIALALGGLLGRLLSEGVGCRRHIHGLSHCDAEGECLFSSFLRAPGEH